MRVLRSARRRLRRLPNPATFVLEQYIQPQRFHRLVQHVAGPQEVEYGRDEVLAICVARNGEVHVARFLEHHFEIGVRHVVLLDNGSTDDTVAIARSFDRVTVLRTDAPYQRYENTMKRYLARRFSRHHWNLCVDIDERFDYPYSDALDLTDLSRYLGERRYTAVVAQMLDLFPDATLAELQEMDQGPWQELHAYYDIANIRRTNYMWGILPSNADIRMHRDGIRNTLFGSCNGLTKAPLIYVNDRVELFAQWHHVNNARIADFTAVLLHFPFAGRFYAKVEDAMKNSRYGGVTATEYDRYWNVLERNGGTRLRQPTSRQWRGIETLIDEGFLVVSPEYQDWATALRTQRKAAAVQVSSSIS